MTLKAFPFPPNFEKREIATREYDREYVDGATVADLDAELLRLVADQVSTGMSIDRCNILASQSMTALLVSD